MIEKPADQPIPEELREVSTVDPKQEEEIKEGKHYNCGQVAHIIGFSREYVRVLCRDGRIPAVKPVGTHWRIPESAVKEMVKGSTAALKPKVKKPTSIELSVPANRAELIFGKTPAVENPSAEEKPAESPPEPKPKAPERWSPFRPRFTKEK